MGWKVKHVGFVCLCMATLVVCLVLYAPIARPAEMEKSKIIKTYHLPAITGVYAPVAIPLFRGMEVGHRYTNEVLGGIRGYKLEMMWADTGYVLARSLSLYKRFKTEGAQVMFLYGSGDGEGLKELAKNDGIILYNVTMSDPQIYPPANNIIEGPPYADNFVSLLEWLRQNWNRSEPMKAAFIGVDYPFCHTIAEVCQAVAPKLDIKWIGTEYVSPSVTESTVPLTRFKRDGANILLASLPAGQAPVVVKDFHRLELAKVMNLYNIPWVPGDAIVAMAGKEASEGYNCLQFSKTPGEAKTDPGVKKAADYWGSIYATPMATINMMSWAFWEFASDILGRALDKVKTPDKLTGAVLLETTEETKEFRGMLTPGLVSLQKGDRIAFNNFRIIQVQNGEQVPLTNWIRVRPVPRDSSGKLQLERYVPPKR